MQIAWKTQSGVTFGNVSRPASREYWRESVLGSNLARRAFLLSPSAGRLSLCATAAAVEIPWNVTKQEDHPFPSGRVSRLFLLSLTAGLLQNEQNVTSPEG